MRERPLCIGLTISYLLSPRQESNLHYILRKDASYPLNDEGDMHRVDEFYSKVNLVYPASTRIRFAMRDFMRAAVFSLITPLFAALSTAL